MSTTKEQNQQKTDTKPAPDLKAASDKKPAAINLIWLYIVVISIIVAAYTGRMDAVGKASFDSAKRAVELAISLIGAMALWLGIMKVAESAGLMRAVTRAIRPVMVWLFPDVPANHPAMSAIIMNMGANMLGMGNAATPMGIKAMQELDKLNPEKGTATNAMCLFLAINTSSVTILPLGVIAVRAASGSTNPGGILLPTLCATLCSTAAAIFMAKLLSRRSEKKFIQASLSTQISGETAAEEANNSQIQTEELSPPGKFGKFAAWGALALFIGAIPYTIMTGGPVGGVFESITASTAWLIPGLIIAILLGGYLCGVKVYETVTDGAKEGFQVAIRIIPFMVAIFVGIGMLRSSGALDLFTGIAGSFTKLIGMPAEVLPHALLRPLSGTGAYGYMAELIQKAPDSLEAFMSSILQGSTETTFYVLAVYFGAIGIRKTRHALPAALFSDAVGICAAVLFANLFFNMFNG
ncbi:MAG: spore maturation protein [Chitinispirillia bacterium]|nr:spore maturation protein [Chitinispirillia bacterium]